MGTRCRGWELGVLLICDAAPFTGGLVQVSLGKRKRGNSATDLVFAMAMFDCDEHQDCKHTHLQGERRRSSCDTNGLGRDSSPDFPEYGSKQTFAIYGLWNVGISVRALKSTGFLLKHTGCRLLHSEFGIH